MSTLLLAAVTFAQEEETTEPEATESAEPTGEEGAKTMLGMSILGNEEAPKSLVIVPWKSSQIGDGQGVENSMDDRAVPVDREVFMREVRYYELRSGSTD
jgi:NOL1/NOP2/fmu family ribosome biogenesis protein